MLSEWTTRKRILPIIVGICLLLAIAIVKLQPAMQHEPDAGFITPVKIIEVKQYLVKPAIIGFGVVEPDILFEAKAEISGKIVYIHPQLRDGEVFAKNTEVLRIEQEDYQLALQQAHANVAISQAKLREIKIQFENTRVDLQLAKAKLALAKKDLQRYQKLSEKKLISQSAVDAQRANVLKLKQEVQNLESLLRTLPEQQRSLEAMLANSEAVARTQERNLERTSIRLPFNARITRLLVDENQFVSQGTILFSAQTTDKILINAQFPLKQFRQLAKDFRNDQALFQQAFQNGFASDFFVRLGLTAKVNLADDKNLFWNAKVERISSSMDPAARTLGIIVSVDRPYQQIQPGTKPPLMAGMYAEVRLQGKARGFYLIPRDALHERELFFCNKENQLQRRQIQPFQLQGNLALFENGMQTGEKIVVSDLFPAIPGMQLKPILDIATQRQIKKWVQEQ